MGIGSMATLAESFRILRPFWPMAAFATFAGSLSGLASAALLATINRALHTDGEALFAILLTFAGLSVISLTGEFIGNTGNSLVGQRITASLRKDLSAKIVAAPIAEIENYRPHKLIAALAQDVNTIALVALNFSTIAIAFSIAAGCFAYLAFLSPAMFVVVLVATVLVVAAQIAASRASAKGFNAVRDAHDDLQKHYRAIIDGAKEIRINRERRLRIMNKLTNTIERIGEQFMFAARIFFAARAFNSALFYATLLLVLMVGRGVVDDKEAMSGVILVLLYAKGPIEQVVAALPLFGEAQVSFRRVAELSTAFANGEPRLLGAPSAMHLTGDTIELREACYEFPTPEGGAAFFLGPVNLTINRGELIFIVGKNGSGKTTLIKLLLGLYVPVEGELRCDGQRIEILPTRRLSPAILGNLF